MNCQMSENEKLRYREICQRATIQTLWDDLATLYKPSETRFTPQTEWKIEAIKDEITSRMQPQTTKERK